MNQYIATIESALRYARGVTIGYRYGNTPWQKVQKGLAAVAALRQGATPSTIRPVQEVLIYLWDLTQLKDAKGLDVLVCKTLRGLEALEDLERQVLGEQLLLLPEGDRQAKGVTQGSP